ncbi:hydrolase [Rossellomorea vietnamensis]|uniref:Hydrolase n=1 Tax=Rossellomorea vietnamensis TaxID=218284 RepID=A0A5D4KFC8_9BACI|nr:C40 family peptidase [Rossellomorea vietnamensis]TYR76011.1 hydrolase [Rossellomorea vietnamensis]
MRKKILSLLIISTIISLLLSSMTSASSTAGDKVAESAKSYLGTPYVFGGSSPAGFDCSGFILFIYKKFSISLPRTSADQFGSGDKVAKADLKAGDLVFFQNTYKKGISHTGIYIGNNNFISAANGGVQIDSINDPYYWGPKYAGARRVVKEEIVKEAEVVKPLPAGQYYDVPKGFWAFDQISFLGQQGIISGYDISQFKPEQNVSRAEVAKMMSDTFNLTPSTANRFSDVSNNHWAMKYINAVADQGFFVGYGNGTFKPDEPISRGEIATLFTKAFNLTGKESAQQFIDLDENHWAYGDIHTLTASSIAFGYKDSSFQPNREASRSEFAVFLYRAIHTK